MFKSVLFLVLLTVVPGFLERYEPNWNSLESRPLPTWFDEAKIGIFIHWGVFSVPSYGNEWFWYRWKTDKRPNFVEYMEKNYKPSFTYQDFAKEFTAELFDPAEWANIFKNSGAKYVVLTTKHHEGYTLWPSNYSYSWNAKDVGPNRNLVDELGKAIRAVNLTWGLYHSLREWYNPFYLADQANNWTTRTFPEQKIIPALTELVENYKPSLIFSDSHNGGSAEYWGSFDFLAWLYNDSPVKDYVIVNDRWGAGCGCKHGGYFTCTDRFNPGVLQAHKWENAMSLDKKSYGFRRDAKLEEYYTISELIAELASTVSCGGNILINIGPTKDGIISPIFQDRLANLGKWLVINGEAIYGSKPWTAQNDTATSHVWYTSKNDAIYAIVLFWPTGNVLKLRSIFDLFMADVMIVTLLGNEEDGKLATGINHDTISFNFPDKATVKSEWAFVLKIENATKTELV